MKDPCRNNRTPIKKQASPSVEPPRLNSGVMTARKTEKHDSAELRRQAEEMIRGKAAPMPEPPQALSPAEAQRSVHELQVHQRELEIQNEELRRSHLELDAARARYFDLYELAPVGYFTLSEQGLILEANLAAAALLGEARGNLVKRPLSRFIFPGDNDIYYRQRRLLVETGVPQVCELRLVKKDGTPFWARLEATAAQDTAGASVYRAVMSDINDRKRAEESLQRAHDELEHHVAGRTEELRQANQELRTEINERKQAEEARRESEANFRNMVEQLVDVLFATDSNGFITFVSPSALQMFGWKPEEMVGKNFIDLLQEPEIPDAVVQFKNDLVSGRKTQSLSFVMKRKDRSTFPGELTKSLIWKDGRTAGTLCMIRDITERKRAETELKESEERYRNQVEAINDVAYAVGGDGEITYISPVVRNLLGYEPDEIIGRPSLEFVHQEDHDLLTRIFSELREGVVSHNEYRVIGKSGDVRWVRSQTSPILDIGGFAGGRGILVDITEDKRAGEALRKAEKNFRRSLDESPLGVRIVTIDGETIYANRAILTILGCETFEELKTTPMKKCYTPESYAEFRIRREKRRQGDDVPSEYTIDIIRKNEEVRHLQVFRKEILWDGERQFQVIYQDITERRRAEEALAAKSVQLEETNTALRVLLQCVKEEQQKIEKRITANIRKLVMPNLEQLRDLRLNDLQKNCLDIVTVNLQQVTSPFLQNLGTCFADFTPREIQVANMIRQGKTSKEIADIFHTSIRNIDFHRDNIRKKLGLSHQKSNLRTFLMKLSEE